MDSLAVHLTEVDASVQDEIDQYQSLYHTGDCADLEEVPEEAELMGLVPPHIACLELM